MHRNSGRYPKSEYYLEILCLPDNQLFSPSEITRRKYDKSKDLESFQKMFHAIYQFGVRNGIALNPDNCLRRAGGKPFMEKGRAKLKTGERSARWLGKTWKSKLYIEDHIVIKKFAVTKLVRVLSQIQAEKAKGQLMNEKPCQQTTQKPKTKRKYSMWGVPLIAAILLTGFSIYNYNFLREGYSVLREEGAKSAITYFQTRGETYDNIFGEAWASYRNGDYDQAETLALKVLESRAENNQARAAYLLGELKCIEGAYDEAMEHLLTALALYEAMGKTKSQYNTRLSLAKLYLSQKDVQNATYYLNLAEQNHANAWEDEYFLYFKSEIAFLENDFEAALKLSLDRVPLAQGDVSRLSGIFSTIGLYFGLTGNLDESLAYTVKAQGMASKQENILNLMYNNLNMCLYLKCSMRDYSELRETILDYSRSNKDIRLMEMMYFIDKFTCPLTPGEPGHVPPPDRAYSELENHPGEGNDTSRYPSEHPIKQD